MFTDEVGDIAVEFDTEAAESWEKLSGDIKASLASVGFALDTAGLVGGGYNQMKFEMNRELDEMSQEWENTKSL